MLQNTVNALPRHVLKGYSPTPTLLPVSEETRREVMSGPDRTQQTSNRLRICARRAPRAAEVPKNSREKGRKRRQGSLKIKQNIKNEGLLPGPLSYSLLLSLLQ